MNIVCLKQWQCRMKFLGGRWGKLDGSHEMCPSGCLWTPHCALLLHNSHAFCILHSYRFQTTVFYMYLGSRHFVLRPVIVPSLWSCFSQETSKRERKWQRVRQRDREKEGALTRDSSSATQTWTRPVQWSYWDNKERESKLYRCCDVAAPHGRREGKEEKMMQAWTWENRVRARDHFQ